MGKYQEVNNLAPIVLFTYNRLSETIKTVEALRKNFLATKSQFVYSQMDQKMKQEKRKLTK